MRRGEAFLRRDGGALECSEWDNFSSVLSECSEVGTMDTLTDSNWTALEELQALAGI